MFSEGPEDKLDIGARMEQKTPATFILVATVVVLAMLVSVAFLFVPDVFKGDSIRGRPRPAPVEDTRR